MQAVALKFVTIEGFRSFVEKSTLEINPKPGVTALIGSNGAGKSTLLQAILFGLGSKASDSGGKSIADLVSSKFLRVECTFSSAKGDIIVASHVCKLTGERSYYFQGHKIARYRFDEELYSIGLNVNSPFWHIRQNGVQSILAAPPVQLHDYMCEVAGTKSICEQRTIVLKQIESWRSSLRDITSLLSEAEATVEEETGYLEAFNHLKDLGQRLTLYSSQLKNVLKKTQIAKIAAAKDSLSCAISAANLAQEECLKLKEEFDSARMASKEMKKKHDKTVLELESIQSTESKCEAAVARAEMELQLELTAYEENAASKKHWQEVLHSALSMRTGKLSEISLMEQKLEILNVKRARLSSEALSFESQLNTPLDNIDAAKILAKHKQSLEEAVISLSSQAEASDYLFATSQKGISKLQASMSMLKDEKQTQEQDLLKWLSISNLKSINELPAKISLVENEQKKAKVRFMDLSQELENLQQSSFSIRCRLGSASWSKEMREQNYGAYLFEILKFKPEAQYHIDALNSILMGNLSVWVCFTTKDASKVLEKSKFQDGRRSIRIWAHDRISSARHSRSVPWDCIHEFASLKWPDCHTAILDPKNLINYDYYDSKTIKAIDRALGGWLIAKNEQVACELVNKFRDSVRCVTSSGRKHIFGELIGSNSRTGHEQSGGVCAALAYAECELKTVNLQHDISTTKEYQGQLEKNLTSALHIKDVILPSIKRTDEQLYEATCRLNKAEAVSISCSIQSKSLREELELVKKSLELCELSISRTDNPDCSCLELMKQQFADIILELSEVEKLIEWSSTQLGIHMDQLQESKEIELNARTALENLGECEVSEEYTKKTDGVIIEIKEKELKKLLEEVKLAKSHLDATEKCEEEIHNKLNLLETKHKELSRAVSLKTKNVQSCQEEVAAAEKELLKCSEASELLDHSMSSFTPLVQKSDQEVLVLNDEFERVFDERYGNVVNAKSMLLQLQHEKAEIVAAQSETQEEEEKLSKYVHSLEKSVDVTQLRLRKTQVETLQQQLESVQKAIAHLEEGAVLIQQRMEMANEACFESVKRAFAHFFSCLIPTKSAVLLRDKTLQTLEFQIFNTVEGGVAKNAKELSGGQQSLLGMAFVFALSSYHAAPLYLLDEIDAALDVSNQSRVAELLPKVFAGAQVLCVSHHATTQSLAANIVRVVMENGSSKVL